MINKKNIIVVFFLFSLLFFSSNSYAEPKWYQCTVKYVGPALDTVLIALVDTAASPSFPPKWFMLDSSEANKLLAIALTAAANQSTVLVYVDIDVGQYPLIEIMYLAL